jgi:hypothetical protein
LGQVGGDLCQLPNMSIAYQRTRQRRSARRTAKWFPKMTCP